MTDINEEFLTESLTEIVNSEIEKIKNPNMTKREKFKQVSGIAISRFKREFPNVDILQFYEDDGSYQITLSINDLH